MPEAKTGKKGCVNRGGHAVIRNASLPGSDKNQLGLSTRLLSVRPHLGTPLPATSICAYVQSAMAETTLCPMRDTRAEERIS